MAGSFIANCTTGSSGCVSFEFDISSIIRYCYLSNAVYRPARTGGCSIGVELNGAIAGQRDRGSGVNSTA